MCNFCIFCIFDLSHFICTYPQFIHIVIHTFIKLSTNLSTNVLTSEPFINYINVERGNTLMKNNVLNAVENVTIVLGVAISLETIYSILGIVLLVFQIALIVYKVVRAIREHVKNKEYNKIPEEIEKGKNDIESVINKHGNETK